MYISYNPIVHNHPVVSHTTLSIVMRSTLVLDHGRRAESIHDALSGRGEQLLRSGQQY
jgi:hypothetical protein